MERSKVNIFGVKISNINEDELIREIITALHAERIKNQVFSYVNVHGLNLAFSNPAFRQTLVNSEIVFADGTGLKIVNNLFSSSKLKAAMTPPSWMHKMFGQLPAGTSLFFIGDEEDVIQRYSSLVRSEFPHLHIHGCSNGFFLKEGKEDLLLNDLKKSAPDIVLVGMGMPVQEEWIMKVKDMTNVKIWIPVGAYFKWMIGDQVRPHRLVTKIGMEWAYRFMLNPRRMFRRYIIGNPLFVFRFIRYLMFNNKVN